MEGRRITTSRPRAGSRAPPVWSAPLLEDADEGSLPLNQSKQKLQTFLLTQEVSVPRPRYTNLLDVSGTRSDPAGVRRTPCPLCGGIPPHPRRPAVRLQSKRLPPHACGPLDPASSQLVASLENINEGQSHVTAAFYMCIFSINLIFKHSKLNLRWTSSKVKFTEIRLNELRSEIYSLKACSRVLHVNH